MNTTDIAAHLDLMQRSADWLYARSYDGHILDGGYGPLAAQAVDLDYQLGQIESGRRVMCNYCAEYVPATATTPVDFCNGSFGRMCDRCERRMMAE